MSDLGPPAGKPLEMVRQRNPNMRCGTCDNYEAGECHRGFPQVVVLPKREIQMQDGKPIATMGIGVNSTFAPVMPDSWCHDWAPIVDENWVHVLPKTKTG